MPSDKKSGICHGMVPPRILYIMILTYIFHIKNFEMWIPRKRWELANEMLKYNFHRDWYLPANGIISNVLHDLDLHIQGKSISCYDFRMSPADLPRLAPTSPWSCSCLTLHFNYSCIVNAFTLNGWLFLPKCSHWRVVCCRHLLTVLVTRLIGGTEYRCVDQHTGHCHTLTSYTDVIHWRRSMMEMANSSLNHDDISQLVDQMFASSGLERRNSLKFNDFCRVLNDKMDMLWDVCLDWKGEKTSSFSSRVRVKRHRCLHAGNLNLQMYHDGTVLDYLINLFLYKCYLDAI